MAWSVEQKLYEAYQNMQDVHLTMHDVDQLVGPDDAIRSRISNVACREAGIAEGEGDALETHNHETWEQFKERLKGGS